MANLLIDAGAEINGPLVACASGDNVKVAALLLDAGASINGTGGGWSSLEEALYWGSTPCAICCSSAARRFKTCE